MYIVRAELKRCFGPGILIPALLLSFFAGYILYELHDDYDSSYCLTADEIKTEYVIACDLITGGYSKTTDLLTRYKELLLLPIKSLPLAKNYMILELQINNLTI